MKVYRCIEGNIINKADDKMCACANTFDYEKGTEYIHFFLFAETAKVYRECIINYIPTSYIECDIPTELLLKYQGYGMYSCNGGKACYIPFPEFAIPTGEFRIEMITSVSNVIKEEWKRTDDFREYLNSIPKEVIPKRGWAYLDLDFDKEKVRQINCQKFMKIKNES